jgi:hypothetical protein
MFHPVDRPMERGWVGRVEDDHVVHLAAQTLQALFTGGGTAREHAFYPLGGVRLLAPVLHPPAVRVFEDERTFTFANPAAVVGPGAKVAAQQLVPRLAGVVGADGAIAGFTLLVEWRRPALAPPKDRDFALATGPIVVTADALDAQRLPVSVRVDGSERARGAFGRFDWVAARDLAAEGTRLYPGDLLVGPAGETTSQLPVNGIVEVDVPGIGVLEQVLVA